MPIKFEYSDKEKSEINQALKECKNPNEYKRFQCIKLRIENKMKLKEIAEITGYNYKYVSQMISKFNNDGIKALYNAHREANRRYMSKTEEKDFLNEFIKQSENGNMLIVDDIRKAYSTRVGKETSKNGIYKVLNRNGWRKVMPRSKHPKKASDDAIVAYKKNQ